MKYTITLEYQGKKYTYRDPFDYQGWTDHNSDYQVNYMYNEGNYSCDCNRSEFIGYYCDKTFPEMPCGEKIKLVSIKRA